MKHFISIIAIMLMAISCNTSKTLVAYFSATGTTKAVAEQIAQAVNADLFEIQPVEAYTEADLDWRDSSSRSSVEMADKSSRPAVAQKVNKPARYDTVYIGFPIWWYTAPTIINTFIEENDLSGKTVKFFATSGGSDIRKAVRQFQADYPELNLVGGKLLNAPSEADIEALIAMEEPERMLCGGYTEQREPTEEEMALFRDVTGTGDIVLTPLSVSTQVVAGLNYKFWCRSENKADGSSGHCWVTIYKPLQGQAVLSGIEVADKN